MRNAFFAIALMGASVGFVTSFSGGAEAQPSEEGETVERPPEGARRGLLSVPAYVPVIVGAAVAALAIAHLISRARRGRP